MKHISIKRAITPLITFLLLNIGTIQTHAQYYIMNIRQTDGTQISFATSDVDSLWFDGLYEFVDLGLSVNWATFNIGATKPEEYGDYFAWGMTEPYYEDGYAQEYPQKHWKEGYFDGYVESYYKSNSNLTKYNNYSCDNKSVLDLSDDVAHVKGGGDWRMPTQAEFMELCHPDNCTWTWTTQNGTKGYLVTSKKPGYEDASIFLPATGIFRGMYLSGIGDGGYYWSSLVKSDINAWYLYFNSSDYYTNNSQINRHHGCTVRPVHPSHTTQPLKTVASIVLSKDELSIKVGDTITLSATPLDEDGNIITANVIVSWLSSYDRTAVVENGRIIAVNRGTCSIIARIGNVESRCDITVTPAIQYEYVDLGLSVKWATCNVGATKPEEYGDYFAWGVTEPYYEAGYAQSENPNWKSGKADGYSWSSYIYGDYLQLSKYVSKYDYGVEGYTDNKTTLDLFDDAAYAKCGNNWRMPTDAELNELRDNCTWTWTTLNGVNGYKVTSSKSGYTDRSIFLPAAGYRRGTSLNDPGSRGYYWSSSLYTDSPLNACYLYFNSNNYRKDPYALRYYGATVRPVCP